MKTANCFLISQIQKLNFLLFVVFPKLVVYLTFQFWILQFYIYMYFCTLRQEVKDSV